MDHTVCGILALAGPIDYFSLFLTSDIIQILVDETNLYATQVIQTANDITPFCLHGWTPTDAKEMEQFVGLLGWMGIVKVAELPNYWSKSKLSSFDLPKKVVARNRFELLLRFWHFADNNSSIPGDRTHKIKNVFQKFVENFKKAYTPGTRICIDETMVPFRGRLSFRQYIPSKRHRYGIKLYKLCTDKGYTWHVKVYVGRDLTGDPTQVTSRNVTLNLIQDLLADVECST
ncbi:Transposase IS4 [Popillia japonica]|uniref:Transposase IS4 n=1 Tax=Popillia japonica TaxID=7064 RepID=A0AAW1MDE3_POPJA